MSSTKRAWKLQEFVAHSSNVNCLDLGKKTGRVLVTGSDDKKVNLWTVGKPNCVMSLSGHTSAVESVKFGNNEEMVVAGSMSGALKLWDLEQAKIIRTLTGHKANIRCLDFHPYGDFVASGALDTNVKLWDIRRKGCIFTYKGHTSGINDLKFSPDGRWVASAGDDNLVKIWDLAAGKLLSELKHHSGAVTSIQFHPSEYLLASGSADRTIAFWELEKFSCIDVTDTDNSGIRCVVFHPEGACIYGGTHDLLKVYSWEPSRCVDSVNMTWSKVNDMAITAQGQLIGATFNQTNVSTFVLDLSRTAPVGEAPVGEAPAGQLVSPPTAAGRRTHERPSTTSTKQAPSEEKIPQPSRQVVSNNISNLRSSSPTQSTRHTSIERSNNNSANAANSPSLQRSQSVNSISLNKPQLNRSTALRARRIREKQEQFAAIQAQKQELLDYHLNNRNSTPSFDTNSLPRRRTSRRIDRPQRQDSLPDESQQAGTPTCYNTTHIVPTNTRISATPAEQPEDSAAPEEAADDGNSTADVQDPSEYERVFKPTTSLAKSPSTKADPFPAPKEDEVSRLAADFSKKPTFSQAPPSARVAPHSNPPSNRISQPGALPKHLESAIRSNDPRDGLGRGEPSDPYADFQPKRPQYSDDYAAISQISKGHNSMSALLSARSKNLEVVRAMWSSGNIKTALDSAVQMQDQSVIVDVLNVLNYRPHDMTLDVVDMLIAPMTSLIHSKYEAQQWSLDVAALLLPHVSKLVISKHESHVHVACSSLKIVLKTFTPLIKQNLQPPSRLGVDITAEERHRKCTDIYRRIQDMRTTIDGKQYQPGKVGATFKEIQLLLSNLDT